MYNGKCDGECDKKCKKNCNPNNSDIKLLKDGLKKNLDIALSLSNITEIYLCGGGALNGFLVERLKTLMPKNNIQLTDALGIPTQYVEAAAFAWLAKQTLFLKPGNLPEVTGAKGLRILGALYPA